MDTINKRKNEFNEEMIVKKQKITEILEEVVNVCQVATISTEHQLDTVMEPDINKRKNEFNEENINKKQNCDNEILEELKTECSITTVVSDQQLESGIYIYPYGAFGLNLVEPLRPSGFINMDRFQDITEVSVSGTLYYRDGDSWITKNNK